MKDPLLQSIRSFGTFEVEQESEFLLLVKRREIEKGGVVLEIGEISSELIFVDAGSFMQYCLDAEHNLVVKNLFTRHAWMLDQASFTARKPSNYRIEAFEDSVVRAININDLHQLIGQYPAFFALGKILEVVDDFSDPKQGPDEKYRKLLLDSPQIIRTFPLKYIASLLGMTPETLSRVRSRMT